MENKSHALAAGTFVLLMAALLISAIVWLTRDTRALREYELSGRVSLTGLQPQASVRYRGVPVGKVTRIGLNPADRTQVLVRIAVEEFAPVNASTFASLGYQGVTGLAYVQLDDNGTPNPGAPTGPIPLKPALMTKLTDQGERMLGQLGQSAERFNELLSPANQTTLIAAVDNMGKAAADLQQLSANLRQTWPGIASNSRETLDSVKATSQRLSDSAAEVRASARAFRATNERLNTPNGTLDQLERAADTLASAGQTLRLTTLPSVNQAVQETTRTVGQLGELSQTLSDSPQSLILGKPVLLPGPGEPGFAPPPAAAR